ncbi:hypothetical protein F5Y11DRAFT_328444 [Daldinia sp. FL1419]|nr:hypothetical protein F5Y11DRAFT_328444 [Daldinia sp. FL1419]
MVDDAAALPANSQNPAPNTSTTPTDPVPTGPVPVNRFPDIMKPWRRPEPRHVNYDDRLLQSIYIYHPYYTKEDKFSSMLRFITTDGGVQYLMLYYACCILADNCMKDDEGRDPAVTNSPFLSKSPKPEDRIKIPTNDIIEAGTYYFIKPSNNPEDQYGEHYAITPTFDDWSPPPIIPSPWREVELPVPPELLRTIHNRKDEPCYVTNADHGVEAAHIIPKSEQLWANQTIGDENMPARNINIIEDWRNKIPLRSDLHHLWDHGYLTFFPKVITCTLPRIYRLAIHVSRAVPDATRTNYLLEKYQNILIENLYGVPAKFLFIRFAWGIFNEDAMAMFSGKKAYYRVKVHIPGIGKDIRYRINKDIYKKQSGSSRFYSPRHAQEKKLKGPPASGNPNDDHNLNGDEFLSSSDLECGGYLSPTESEVSNAIYDWPTEDEAEAEDEEDSLSDMSDQSILDDGFYRNAPVLQSEMPAYNEQDDGSHEGISDNESHKNALLLPELPTCDEHDNHQPRKRLRPSFPDVITKNSTRVSFGPIRKEDSDLSAGSSQTPNLSESVETVKTDQDTAHDSGKQIRLGSYPALPTTPPHKPHEPTRSTGNHDDSPISSTD